MEGLEEDVLLEASLDSCVLISEVSDSFWACSSRLLALSDDIVLSCSLQVEM